MKKLLLFSILCVFFINNAYASAPTRPNLYVAGTTIDPVAVTLNETTLYSYLQSGVDTFAAGSISNVSISNTAGILSSKLNLSNITGVFNIGTPNQGDIFYDNGTQFTRLTPGTTGQVLVTQGANANPQWGFGQFLPQNIQVFTTSGTWVKPSGINNVYVKVIGRGGNGVNGSASGAGGGGGGGYSEGIVAVTGNVTVTIGSTNSFAGTTTIQSTSGSNASGQTGGAGGVGSNGTINLTGSTGQGGQNSGNNTASGGSGGGTAMGSGGGGGSAIGGNGSNGGQYGGGGGGAGNSAGTGGTGDSGAVIVYY